MPTEAAGNNVPCKKCSSTLRQCFGLFPMIDNVLVITWSMQVDSEEIA